MQPGAAATVWRLVAAMYETVDGGTAPANGQALDTMLDPGTGPLLLDSSGLTDRLLAFFDAGGPVVMILLACSVVALTIVLLQFWQLHAARLGAIGGASCRARGCPYVLIPAGAV